VSSDGFKSSAKTRYRSTLKGKEKVLLVKREGQDKKEGSI